jgi:hypothetical protein
MIQRKMKKKRLAFEKEGTQTYEDPETLAGEPNKNSLMMIEGGKEHETGVVTGENVKDTKRHKKDGDTSSTNSGSAASFEDGRRTQ